MSEEQREFAVTVHRPFDMTETAMSSKNVIAQVNLIQHVMRDVMQKDQHYGVIPGCGQKPTLLKPGAEKLSLTFRLSPQYDIRKTDLPNGHREYEIVCTLLHIPSGQVVGQGVGAASTMESKYRYRKGERKCPRCQQGTIMKSKFGAGGWYCNQKAGGCGAQFKAGDPAIEGQQTGRAENPDPADTYNTVLKMAKKRAHVDAVLTATAASDIFTQDIEDMVDAAPEPVTAHAEPSPAPPQEPETYPESEPEPEWATKAQLTKINAMWNGRPREDLYRFLSDVTARSITSGNQLTKHDAMMVIDALEAESQGDEQEAV